MNKKSFYRYIGSKIKIQQNFPLFTATDHLVMKDMRKTYTCQHLPCFGLYCSQTFLLSIHYRRVYRRQNLSKAEEDNVRAT